ncbi:MAG: Flp pilus assembly protein CpaB [Gemmatimonadales bacterium]|jgi:pilus assembly protein CpaB|nr:MAG: Flp pilus assembly protein CpaB [Gemmatimonadales bacterium]
MKKKRTMVVLLLAILSGSVAAFSAVRYLQDRPTPLMASTPTETRPVVVAAREVPLGTTLTEEDLQVIQWPASALPLGIATSTSEVVGRSVIDDLQLNEPVLAGKLADTGLFGLIPLIPEGMRALSVQVDEVIGVAGFVTPRTRVDVILIMQPPGQRETVSKVILQNISALAANQQITETENGQPLISTVVTVLVTPEEAEKLSLAATQGRIQMALRNSLDLEPVETRGETESRLFSSVFRGGGGARSQGRTSSAPNESIIEMYQGAVRTLVTYN